MGRTRCDWSTSRFLRPVIAFTQKATPAGIAAHGHDAAIVCLHHNNCIASSTSFCQRRQRLPDHQNFACIYFSPPVAPPSLPIRSKTTSSVTDPFRARVAPSEPSHRFVPPVPTITPSTHLCGAFTRSPSPLIQQTGPRQHCTRTSTLVRRVSMAT
jgi:hypothetical protein